MVESMQVAGRLTRQSDIWRVPNIGEQGGELRHSDAASVAFVCFGIHPFLLPTIFGMAHKNQTRKGFAMTAHRRMTERANLTLDAETDRLLTRIAESIAEGNRSAAMRQAVKIAAGVLLPPAELERSRVT